MKSLIIGYGSIGRRHYDVLSSLRMFDEIHVVTKSSPDGITVFHSLEEVPSIDAYDYYVIASETYKHLEQLKYLDSRVKGRTIFCEKPLFMTYEDYKPENNNVIAGYVLRFHPLIGYIRELIKGRKVLDVNVYCGSYLPEWRQSDYRQSYSAKKQDGGGALLDISHEIDYSAHLFGKLTELKSIQTKVSGLEIDSDDTVHIIGRTENGTVMSLSMNYTSRIPVRKMIIICEDMTLCADMLECSYDVRYGDGETETYKLKKTDRNGMFVAMHTAALTDNKYICSYDDALSVMKTIQMVQGENNE